MAAVIACASGLIGFWASASGRIHVSSASQVTAIVAHSTANAAIAGPRSDTRRAIPTPATSMPAGASSAGPAARKASGYCPPTNAATAQKSAPTRTMSPASEAATGLSARPRSSAPSHRTATPSAAKG